MREDIAGMLKNAIDHGGNPRRIAQSLINSGYPMKDVKEAYDYVISSNPQLSQQSQPSQASQGQIVKNTNKSSTQFNQSNLKPTFNITAQTPQLKPLKPLPSQRINPSGTGKIAIMIILLALLILSLITVIIFKDTILDLFRL